MPVRYATATMQVHAVHRADQPPMITSLEERVVELRALKREVAPAELELVHDLNANPARSQFISTRTSACSRSRHTGFAASKGRLESPADGPIVSRFGADPHGLGEAVVRWNGVGLRAEPTTRVRATLEGRVVNRGDLPGTERSSSWRTATTIPRCMVIWARGE